MTAEKKLYAHAKLRRLRREHGLTQAELARRLDISTSYLNQIENSQRTLTAPVLLRLAKVLGVDPEHFADTDTERLGLDPLIDLGLRLGEGTGALLALPVVTGAARVLHEVATFDSAGVAEK
ncbi:helix-turn-helix domain-containing protein [Verrucosispora sp. SN26_14.1]|nr:helix-turn-helix domain-containing protein [Verrucosispora sp. SN26_14.1]